MTTYDTELYINIPRNAENNLPVVNETDLGESFRSKAAKVLKKEFGSNYWTLRETANGTSTSLKVAVRNTALSRFRERIKELGFSEVRRDGSEMTEDHAGRNNE